MSDGIEIQECQHCGKALLGSQARGAHEKQCPENDDRIKRDPGSFGSPGTKNKYEQYATRLREHIEERGVDGRVVATASELTYGRSTVSCGQLLSNMVSKGPIEGVAVERAHAGRTNVWEVSIDGE